MPDQDPKPIVSLYRVLTFVMMILSGLTAFSVVPEIASPWLSLGAFVVSTGLTVFFNGTTQGNKPSEIVKSQLAKPQA